MQVVTNPTKHLIKGLYPWLAENDPHIFFTFNANHPGVSLTAHSFRVDDAAITTNNGREIPIKIITLNLAPDACGKVRFEEDYLYMQCRSNQVLVECHIPYEAMLRMWCPHDQSGLLQIMPPYHYPTALEEAVEKQAAAADAKPARPTLTRVK